jgi:DNA helicase HerA-like ATPase
MSKLRLPNDTQRIAIVGRTGSGKTYAAAWHLSKRNFDTMPWIIFDFKYDPLLQNLGAIELPLGTLPDKPGLYIVHPFPDDKEGIDNYLWQIWKHENIGVFIDEGYMVGDSSAFRAILTQGRSKRIPMIILSQRPVWLSRFVFSEADFFQVFQLNILNDRMQI